MTNDELRRREADQRLNQLIRDLHEATTIISPLQYRSWALRQTQSIVAFSGAAWGVGLQATNRVHLLHASGLATGFNSSLAPTPLADWLCERACSLPGETALASCTPAGTSLPSLQTAELESLSRLLSFVTIFRGPGEAEFSETDRLTLERLTPHLLTAWRNCQLFDLQVRATAEGHASAIVDTQGFVHLADRRFYKLLRTGWSSWSGARLPAPLAELAQQRSTGVFGNVRWSAEAASDGICLSGRPLGHLGRLTPREHSIATGLIGGQSYAASAEQLGISINTVRNTVVRIYRKLGVSNKLELARRAEFGLTGDAAH